MTELTALLDVLGDWYKEDIGDDFKAGGYDLIMEAYLAYKAAPMPLILEAVKRNEFRETFGTTCSPRDVDNYVYIKTKYYRLLERG